ncbi:hypothetical protein, partial [Pseudomonas sp. MPR-R2A5]|uniref:hypothetical protein n=1 Tax=Pseudomonas sp. MPR-R2A5 TaxID=2070622 RepID=UPI001C48B570
PSFCASAVLAVRMIFATVERKVARICVSCEWTTPYADRSLQFCEAGPNAAAAGYSFTALRSGRAR